MILFKIGDRVKKWNLRIWEHGVIVDIQPFPEEKEPRWDKAWYRIKMDDLGVGVIYCVTSFQNKTLFLE